MVALIYPANMLYPSSSIRIMFGHQNNDKQSLRLRLRLSHYNEYIPTGIEGRILTIISQNRNDSIFDQA